MVRIIILPILIWRKACHNLMVAAIFQAKDRTLWLGSFGGVSNFDGKEFNSLSKADGLVSNTITSLTQDNKGQIIVGTNAGINIIRNGRVVKSISQYPILILKKDKQGVIWGISSGKLFKLVKRQNSRGRYRRPKSHNFK
jgi:hypothetical protein